ncbi:MAG: hypothetical protein IT459_03580 [Planctomycetes bacterium]|nr:hypothetical protein [Planctomycetota bacterium]
MNPVSPSSRRVRRGSVRSLSALLVSCAVGACTNFSEPPPNWQGEFTAQAVLDKSFEAIGGVKSTPEQPAPSAADFVATMKGELFDGPAQGTYTYVAMWKRPDKWRLDQTDTTGKRMSLVSDGVHIAQFVDGKLISRNLPLREAGIQQLSCYLFPLKFFREGAGTQPVLEDVKDTDGGQVIRISKVDPFGNRYVLSIDAQSYMPTSVRTGIPTGDDQYTIRETALSNFQPDARAGLVPRTLEVSTFGKLQERMQVADLRWDQGLPDGQFKTVQ